MRCLSVSDLHGSGESFLRVLKDAGPVDVILICGDITHFGTPDEAEALVRLGQGFCPKVFAVCGNCDSPEIEARLACLGISLHAQGVEWQGVGFQGVSGAPSVGPGMYGLSDLEVTRALGSGLSSIESLGRKIVLSHCPPRATLVDRAFLGRSVGSVALRRFVDELRPTLLVCGHIHEARACERLGPTWVVNGGCGAKGYYSLIDLNETVSVDLRRA